ncbi:uncharacterized protein [Amphiura filiformis]|uniref:uncharacterized protein n=1 Tax=Amphiura filiformis TaxID=82378 RepID=UPI003B2100F0
MNDILCALDVRHEALLVLLDFSSAFDTIDHAILLKHLSSRYGITGTALDWFISYLDGRTQSVNISNDLLEKVPLKWGVPQGSVAGPLIFIYSAPLQDIINSHGINTIVYADDTQLYLTFPPEDRDTAVSRIEKCIQDVKLWAIENKLFLNDAKTEVLHFRSRFSNTSSPSPTVTIGGSEIKASWCVRNLGVHFDDEQRCSHSNSSYRPNSQFFR